MLNYNYAAHGNLPQLQAVEYVTLEHGNYL